MLIRDATAADATACAAVYAPYVRDTAITFELDPPDAAAFAERIARSQRAHAWLVAERDGVVVGYAYAGPHRERAAYRFACDVSVYLAVDLRRTGTGRALYAALLERVGELGYHTALAGITLPNPASEGLHAAFGFEPVGVYRRIGWKLGRWHDVAWSQRPLGPVRDPDVATEPR